MHMSINRILRACSAIFNSLPFHPVLFGIYPVVALLGVNVSQMNADVVLRPLIVLSLGALGILALFRVFLRDWHRAALATVILLLLFFTYGHAYNFLKSVEVGGILLGRHRQMAVVWLVLALAGIWWTGLKKVKPRAYTPVLNFISIFLLIYPTYQSANYLWNLAQARKAAIPQVSVVHDPGLPLGYKPDIYYIILDAYGRSDVLSEAWGIDNQEFLDSLASRGFYVAECSQSNYAHTILSLTSTLNLDYLNALTSDFNAGMDTNASLRTLGQNNFVRRYLVSLDYSVVAFATNYPFTEWNDAEYFYAPPPQGMNDFEILLARTTAWRIPMDLIPRPEDERSTDWYRRRTEYAMQYLKRDVPDIPGPKFVFAHLVIPHHPFVFGPNGEEMDADALDILDFSEYGTGYRNQVTYINNQIKELVDIILENSANPPIIILQGDHGPTDFGVIERRMRVLNAYYLPGNPDGPYPTITPINTFRLILDKYFGQNLGLLEDISLYSTFEKPYEYQTVPESCPE
jgi:hypothetical protein